MAPQIHLDIVTAERQPIRAITDCDRIALRVGGVVSTRVYLDSLPPFDERPQLVISDSVIQMSMHSSSSLRAVRILLLLGALAIEGSVAARDSFAQRHPPTK